MALRGDGRYRSRGATLAGAAQAAAPARFDWFDYEGVEPGPPPSARQYRNPILQGFYPDPSIVRVGERLLSRQFDLRLLPRPADLPQPRPGPLDADRQCDRPARPAQLRRAGDLARHVRAGHQRARRQFYIVNTCVGCGGNFVITAKDPRGPVVEPDCSSESSTAHRSLAVLRRRRQRLDRLQRAAAGQAALRRASRDLAAALRSRDAARLISRRDGAHQRRHRTRKQPDLDRGAAHLQERRLLLSDRGGRRDRGEPFRGRASERARSTGPTFPAPITRS